MFPMGLFIESLVAILLLITIGFCFVLNRRIGSLRSDEQELHAIIADLNEATTRAEHAIAGLRKVAGDTEGVLGRQTRIAEKIAHDLERQSGAGENILSRIAAITKAAEKQRPVSAAAERRAEPVRRPAPPRDRAA
jgi:hypothetical protein